MASKKPASVETELDIPTSIFVIPKNMQPDLKVHGVFLVFVHGRDTIHCQEKTRAIIRAIKKLKETHPAWRHT